MSGEVKLIGAVVVVSLALIAGIAVLGSGVGPQDTVDPQAVIGTNPRVKGASTEDASVTIVEFSDFQCPACASAHPALKQVLDENADTVALIYRHFPLLNIHPNAQAAAYAAEAAGEQGQFWEAHDWLFENQSQWEEAEVSAEYFYDQLGEELGLDRDQFLADYEKDELRQKVADDFAAGREFDVSSTPTFFVNGKRVTGAQTVEQWQDLIAEIQ